MAAVLQQQETGYVIPALSTLESDSAAAEDHGSRMAAPRIREAISVLFQQGRMELAIAVGEAAISVYPYSEDILVICALMAEVEQDWARAESLLIRLIEVQEGDAPAASWLHLLRVLRCQNKTADAVAVADFAGAKYDTDADLQAEIASLRAVTGTAE